MSGHRIAQHVISPREIILVYLLTLLSVRVVTQRAALMVPQILIIIHGSANGVINRKAIIMGSPTLRLVRIAMFHMTVQTVQIVPTRSHPHGHADGAIKKTRFIILFPQI